MKRTKVLIVCKDIEEERLEYLEWSSVLEDHFEKGVKTFLADRRITTPHAILDFVSVLPESSRGYTFVLKPNEEEEILRLSVGE